MINIQGILISRFQPRLFFETYQNIYIITDGAKSMFQIKSAPGYFPALISQLSLTRNSYALLHSNSMSLKGTGPGSNHQQIGDFILAS